MFFSKDEIEIRKIVTFNSVYTSIYFPLLILALLWTNGIYLAGKYKYSLVIFVITVAELVKYFSSTFYLKNYNANLSKKYEDKTTYLINNMFTKGKIKDGFKTTIVVSVMTLVYYVVSILYGAEVFSKYEETFMFSSLLSVLSILPACINLGSQSIVALTLGSKPTNKLESLMYQNLYLTVLGAWLGAFVIPLDWDRPWQEWPIPCSFGAMMGYALSHLLMLFKVKNGQKKKSKRSI